MSDQQVTDVVIEGGKSVGSAGGLLAIVVMLFQRFVKKEERNDEREAKALEGLLAEMKVLNAGVASLTAKVEVLTERDAHRALRIDKAEVRIDSVADRLATLEGKFAHFEEQFIK